MDIRKVSSIISEEIINGNGEIVARLLREHPNVIGPKDEKWLGYAITDNRLDLLKILLDAGCNPNAIHYIGKVPNLPLDSAISCDSVEIVSELLARGANPNLHRQTIGAITTANKNSLPILKLLVQYGADIHRVFKNEHTNQPMNALSTAIDWGKEDVADYLRSLGATMPTELPAESSPTASAEEHPVVAHFRATVGTVDPVSQIEIVPTLPEIQIHSISADSNRNSITLFTSGMSDEPVETQDDASDAFHAELFMELPADWPFRDLDSPQASWPVVWLRKLAQYPAQKGRPFGPAEVMQTGKKQAVLPGTQFSCFLLLSEKSFVREDGVAVRLYRVTPLYREEYELARTRGLPALMHAFDAAGTKLVIDVKRKNVGLT